jgi:hypothetical protein
VEVDAGEQRGSGQRKPEQAQTTKQATLTKQGREELRRVKAVKT